MEANLSPADRPFEVWLVPGDRTPMRIGQKLAKYNDAMTLAQLAITDLPHYGYPSSQVLVIWNNSVLKAFHTVPMPAGPGLIRTQPMLATHIVLRQEIARLALEDLRRLSCGAEPTLAAPPEWIARLESVLRVIASPADQRRYRLDGSHCITMDYLDCRVAAVLRQFDGLVAASIHLPPQSNDGMRLSV